MYKVFFLSIVLTFCQATNAQQMNWQNLDLKQDGLFGISTEKAYQLLLKGKKSSQVIVAILDSGTDTLHEDLKNVLWADPISGIHGWNYIDEETGMEDITRIVSFKKSFYDSLSYTAVPELYRSEYQVHQKIAPELETKIKRMEGLVETFRATESVVDSILGNMGTKNPSLDDFLHFLPTNADEKLICGIVEKRWPLYGDWKLLRQHELSDLMTASRNHIKHGLNVNNSEVDTAAGSSDITPDALGMIASTNPTALHGTHVAGIIGALRNNGIGMNGVADNVSIMTLKVVGNIRELRDKSLADAIKFAVDHGAKIINLSFGKPYTWDKGSVDEAIAYAIDHDVLFIHAAGNTGENLDLVDHYPNPNYQKNSGKASAWIEVGASGPRNDGSLIPEFSNYGKTSVDVFAPGVQIYSTLPGSNYQSWNGTSMAAPVVSGIAALIREYYPSLSASMVKDIIFQSVIKVDHDLLFKGRMVKLSDICSTGGIVNAYTALQLAAQYVDRIGKR